MSQPYAGDRINESVLAGRFQSFSNEPEAESSLLQAGRTQDVLCPTDEQNIARSKASFQNVDGEPGLAVASWKG